MDRCLEIIAEGGCDLTENNYTGPELPVVSTTADGKPKYGISLEFVEGMLEWFKSGKTLPRRYVWEVVLGCHSELVKEQSLTDLVLEEGATCDVIGDTHGMRFSAS